MKQFLKLPTAHSLREAALKCIKAVRAAIPKWLAPAIFGAVLSLGVNAYFKPSLSATLAYSDAVRIEFEGKPTEFVVTLIDRFPKGQAQLVAPTLITFNSENDFQRVPDPGLTIVKILITNVGFATAKRIRAGIGLPPEWNVVVSPNVEVTNEKTIQPMGKNYSGYRVIEISRLTVSETAVFTITGPCLCSSSETPHVSEDGKLFLPTEKSGAGYAPLLFITDEDGSSIQESRVSMKESLEQERSYFPTSAGFWAEGLKVKDGVSPTVKPLEHYTIPWQTIDGRSAELTTDHPTKLD